MLLHSYVIIITTLCGCVIYLIYPIVHDNVAVYIQATASLNKGHVFKFG